MKQKWIWLTSALFAAGIALSLSFPSFAMENGSGKAPPDHPQAATTDHPVVGKDLDTVIKQWMDTLQQQKGFETWQGAISRVYPLGPGVHGWIVHISKDGKDAGYMVINAREDGTFELAEYGTGQHPLFSLTTLYQSLMRQALIPFTVTYEQFTSIYKAERWYRDAFHALWKLQLDGKNLYFDATTAEQLPLQDKEILGEMPVGGLSFTPDPKILETAYVASFDPYGNMGWVVNPPAVIHNFAELKVAMQRFDKIALVTHPFSGRITLAFALTGYHLTDSGLYLCFEQEGSRYVPLYTFQREGQFYNL